MKIDHTAQCTQACTFVRREKSLGSFLHYSKLKNYIREMIFGLNLIWQ